MLREIISGLLIVVLLIAGFLAYVVLYEVKDIKSPSLTLDKEQYQVAKELDSDEFKNELILPFENSVQAQNNWLQEQTKVEKSYQTILDNILINQKLLYIEEYKNDIEDKRTQLDQDFIEYKGRIDKIIDREIEHYSSLIEYEMEQSLKNLRQKYDQEFADYEQKVLQENRNELLNYRLKLETLDLSEEEAQKFRNKIEEIENTKSIKINNKLNEIYYNLRIKSTELANEKERKIDELKEEFLNKKEQQIDQKQLELENMFTVYQRNRYTGLKQNMNKFETDLDQETDGLFAKSAVLTAIIQDDLEVLNKTYLKETGERN